MLMILSCWIVFILLLIYTFYYLTYVAFPLPPTLLIYSVSVFLHYHLNLGGVVIAAQP